MKRIEFFVQISPPARTFTMALFTTMSNQKQCKYPAGGGGLNKS